MKTVVIIQARMGSTRLPGKVMKKIAGKTVLEHVITRVKQCKQIDDIVIATTTNEIDDIIEKESIQCEVKCFRGSEKDVLSRYYLAAKENKADIVVRITSDCPLIDSKVSDKVIEYFKNHNEKYVTCSQADPLRASFPRGLDTEVFSFEGLEEAYFNGDKEYQREHVTPYFYEDLNDIVVVENDVDYSRYRWTLDTKEDWEFINKVYDYLYDGVHNFYMEDILLLMEKYPELYELNKDVQQKKVK